MKRRVIWIVLAVGLSLAACSKKATDDLGASDQPWFGGDQHGRFVGVGIYNPSDEWAHLVANQSAKDSQTAKPIDDQVIIVVEDSVTGEVRAFGDLTGYCIGTNPWKTALVSSQITPVKLTQHSKSDVPDIVVTGEVKKSATPQAPQASNNGGGQSR